MSNNIYKLSSGYRNLYSIPGNTGIGLNFGLLAQYLTDTAFYSLVSPAITGPINELSVRDYAFFCKGQILSTRPTEPINLLGHCYGAAVALEIARCLQPRKVNLILLNPIKLKRNLLSDIARLFGFSQKLSIPVECIYAAKQAMISMENYTPLPLKVKSLVILTESLNATWEKLVEIENRVFFVADSENIHCHSATIATYINSYLQTKY